MYLWEELSVLDSRSLGLRDLSGANVTCFNLKPRQDLTYWLSHVGLPSLNNCVWSVSMWTTLTYITVTVKSQLLLHQTVWHRFTERTFQRKLQPGLIPSLYLASPCWMSSIMACMYLLISVSKGGGGVGRLELGGGGTRFISLLPPTRAKANPRLQFHSLQQKINK